MPSLVTPKINTQGGAAVPLPKSNANTPGRPSDVKKKKQKHTKQNEPISLLCRPLRETAKRIWFCLHLGQAELQFGIHPHCSTCISMKTMQHNEGGNKKKPGAPQAWGLLVESGTERLSAQPIVLACMWTSCSSYKHVFVWSREKAPFDWLNQLADCKRDAWIWVNNVLAGF